MSRLEKLQFSLGEFRKPLNAALCERDSYTQSHCARVVAIADELGRECALPEEEIGMLRICASFHDIGKIGIPDRILLKEAGFDSDEWEVMKQHAVIGERIIRAIDAEGAEEIATAVRHHHEHFDGGGYPDGLAGETIPLWSRIMSIADSYDAMSTTRPYHKARGQAEVMGVLLREQGGKHDPYLLGRFTHLVARGLNA